MNVFERLRNTGLSADDPDRSLIKAAKRGDRRAFDALVRGYSGLLRGYLSRRVQSSAVDDLMQEVLVAGWVALPAFNGRSRFKAWLFGIAMHKCADYHRAIGRERIDSSIELQDRQAAIATTESLDDWSASIDRRAAIQRALARVPDSQREVLEMYYYAELSLPDISRALSRNLNTVKYQFYRAHALAAEVLAGEPGLTDDPAFDGQEETATGQWQRDSPASLGVREGFGNG